MTSRQAAQARANMDAGMSMREAAAASGVEYGTLKGYLYAQAQTARWEELARLDAPRCAPLTAAEVVVAERLYDLGERVKVVAAHLGRHQWVVSRWRTAWRKERARGRV